jgi:Spy/CpxP family protein refolding chaperone
MRRIASLLAEFLQLCDERGVTYYEPMKLSSLLTLCGAAAMVTLPLAPISAQTPTPVAGKTGTEAKPPRHQMPSIEDKLDRMKKNLDLTDDQVAKLKEVFEGQKAAMQPIASDKSLSPKERREKMKPLMEETKTKINAILTPEQQAKFEAARKDRKKDKADKND